ncbi:MAG: PRC-barrel domain-containing protein [Phycisphaerae bacterium]|nr:PRC-barrel domain-containing protein [Phycisphaerae bacterium]
MTLAVAIAAPLLAQSPSDSPSRTSPSRTTPPRADDPNRAPIRTTTQTPDATRLHSVVASEEILGANIVQASTNDTIAEIDDLIIDRGSGRIAAVLVDVDGVSGNRAVDPRQLRSTGQPNKLVFTADTDLRSGADFDRATWFGTKTSEWTKGRSTDEQSMHNDPYRVHSSSSYQKVKGRVESVETIREHDSEFTVVTLRDGDTLRKVIVGPAWYVRSTDAVPYRGETLEYEVGESTGTKDLDGEYVVAVRGNRNNKPTEYRANDGTARWTTTTASGGANDEGFKSRYIMLSDLKGKNVMSRGQRCGEIEDLYVDLGNWDVPVAAIDPDQNFLGIADTIRLVPFSLIMIPTTGPIQVDATKEMVLAAPKASDARNANESFWSGVYTAYGVQDHDRRMNDTERRRVNDPNWNDERDSVRNRDLNDPKNPGRKDPNRNDPKLNDPNRNDPNRNDPNRNDPKNDQSANDRGFWSDDDRVRGEMTRSDETLRGTVRQVTPDRAGSNFTGMYIVDVDSGGKLTRMVVGPSEAIGQGKTALKDGEELVATGRYVTNEGVKYFIPFSVECGGNKTVYRHNDGKPIWR